MRVVSFPCRSRPENFSGCSPQALSKSSSLSSLTSLCHQLLKFSYDPLHRLPRKHHYGHKSRLHIRSHCRSRLPHHRVLLHRPHHRSLPRRRSTDTPCPRFLLLVLECTTSRTCQMRQCRQSVMSRLKRSPNGGSIRTRRTFSIPPDGIGHIWKRSDKQFRIIRKRGV